MHEVYEKQPMFHKKRIGRRNVVVWFGIFKSGGQKLGKAYKNYKEGIIVRHIARYPKTDLSLGKKRYTSYSHVNIGSLN